MSKGMGLGGSIVSKNILEHKGNLKWCIKESPVNELDNGWRFLSDIDTDDFRRCFKYASIRLGNNY